MYSGRPMSVRKTEYVREWEEGRQAEIKELTGKGRIPHEVELETKPERSAPGRACMLSLLSFLGHMADARFQGLWARLRAQSMTSNLRRTCTLLLKNYA